MRFPSRALAASVLVLGTTGAALSPAAAGQARHDDDDRLPAVVTVRTTDYDFELILTPHVNPPVNEPGAPTAWVRRTDDVGRGFEDLPDAHGRVQRSGWDVQSGDECLTSGGGEFTFDDAPVHALTYGIAGRSVRKVVVVLVDGTRLRTRTSRTSVDGFRGWMIERPLVTTARIDGYDRHGRRVASFEPSHLFGDADDYGLDVGSCVPFPFP